jgi:hypothetical protein
VGVLWVWLLAGCAGPPQAPAQPGPVTSPSPTSPTSPGAWVQLGSCEIWQGSPSPVPASLPAPAQCTPAEPGWSSGPVAGWAQAKILGVGPNDTLGYALAAVDPDGDGTDALVVGIPWSGHVDYTYPSYQPPPAGSAQSVSVVLLSELEGEIIPQETQIIATEGNGISSSSGSRWGR